MTTPATKKPGVLSGVQSGEKLIIRDAAGTLVGVGNAICLSESRIAIRYHGYFMLGSGKQVKQEHYKGNQRATRGTSDEIAAAEAELQARIEEKDRRRTAEIQAAYDALPEAVKLARKLGWYCDVTSEQDRAEMPLDILRAAVQWIESVKGETE